MKKPSNTIAWDDLYRESGIETLPWYNPMLDHDLARALGRLHIRKGTVLDIGAGPGTQAIELARLGFDVTATDISETAVRKARKRAAREGLKIKFVQDDIIDSRIRKKFDFVFDRGLFHTLAPKDRVDYVIVVNSLIKAGGFLFLKCFSHKEPGKTGPHRLKPGDIRGLFNSQFQVLSIKDTVFRGVRRPMPRALFCVIRKIGV